MTGERFKALLAEYGKVAMGTYLALFVVTLVGFAIAISMGFAVEGAASSAGLLGAAYVATKLTQPLRIGATMLLTPLVARVVQGRQAPKAEAPSGDEPRPRLNDESTQ